MKVTVNGEERSVDQPKQLLTLAQFIRLLGHNPRLIVVELNGVILPPNKWSFQKVKDGDSLEIVTIVGGGS